MITKPLQPPMPYAGGKQRIATLIADLLPEHKHYVEPYCGGLSVLFAKDPSPHETINDINQKIMTFWQVLRDHPEQLTRACAMTPHSRAEYAAADLDGLDGLDNLEIARRVWVRITQSRTAQLKNTGWRHYQAPTGNTSMPDYLTAYIMRMRDAAARLHDVSLECRPALELIETYGKHDDVLLYLDPPYLQSVRRGGALYADEATDEEHRVMLDIVRQARSAVAISGYRSTMYDDALSGWERHDIPALTGSGERAKESLWVNRPRQARLI